MASRSGADPGIKKFRHDVAILKRKGLISKSYDARSVNPTKYLKSQIKQWSEVIEGRATTVKVSKDNEKFYRQNGFDTKMGRVVVPIQPNQKVTATRGNFRLTTVGKSGSISSRNLTIEATSIPEWLEKLRANKVQFADDEVLAFQYFGNSSRQFFSGNGKTRQQQLADFIERYPSMIEAAKKGGDAEAKLIKSIHLYKIKGDPLANRLPSTPFNEKRDTERERLKAARRSQQRSRRIARMTEREYSEYMDAQAAKQKAYRASLSDKKYDEMLKRNAERARKSEAKRRQAARVKALREFSRAEAKAEKEAQAYQSKVAQQFNKQVSKLSDAVRKLGKAGNGNKKKR